MEILNTVPMSVVKKPITKETVPHVMDNDNLNNTSSLGKESELWKMLLSVPFHRR